MLGNKQVDDMRENLLEQIERHDRQMKNVYRGAAVIEALFWGGYLLLMDFANKTHWLILIAAFAVYTLMGIGLTGVGVHTNRSSLRILKAIELLAEKLENPRD